MPNKTNFKPDGYASATSWIITRDTAKLLDFLKAAFGAVELARIPNPDGKGISHAETRIGDAVVMGFDTPQGWPETPAFIRLYVKDADSSFASALKAGATAVTKPTLLAFGDKVGRVRDPFGNIWWLQTHLEDVPDAEMQRRWTDPAWAGAMAYVQGSLIEAGSL
jgi:PhnB protein